MTFTLVGMLTGAAGAVIAESGSNWWFALIVSIAGPIIGLLIDIVRNILIKKGILGEKEAKDVADKIKDSANNVLEDLKDDGKINNSNKKDKEE